MSEVMSEVMSEDPIAAFLGIDPTEVQATNLFAMLSDQQAITTTQRQFGERLTYNQALERIDDMQQGASQRRKTIPLN